MEKNIKSWDGFLGSNFLKVTDLTSEDQVFICVDAEISDDDRPRLTLQSDERTYLYDLNITDAKEVSNQKINSPNDCIGKKIVFRKATAYSPTAKKDVPTLRIKEIK